MITYHIITLRDRFDYEPVELPGGFLSVHLAADYFDHLINTLTDHGFDLRRLNRLVSISDLVTIEIKQTDQCHWERGTLPEEYTTNLESDILKARKYINESEERLEQFYEELSEFAFASNEIGVVNEGTTHLSTPHNSESLPVTTIVPQLIK
jgi:hypothetical protein